MATRYAVANGNWSSLAVWDGGASLPGVGDDVYADGKAVVIDQNVTVLSIRTTQRAGGTVGGTFTIATTQKITCTGDGLYGGTASSIIVTANSPNTVTINSAINGGVKTNCNVLVINGTAAIIINGNLINGVQNASYSLVHNSTGLITITGNVQGGSGGFSHCILLASSGNLIVTGNVTSINSGMGISSTSTASITINGNVTGSGGNSTAAISSIGVVTVNGGTVTGGTAAACYGIIASGTITVIGSVIGGSNATAYGIYTTGTNSIIITGSVNASNTTPAIYTTSLATIDITGNLTANLFAAVYAPNAYCIVRGNRINAYSSLTTPTYSVCAIVASKLNIDNSLAQNITEHSTNGTARVLSTTNASIFPATTDVRSGIVYGSSGISTGTLIIPPPASVALNVPTDNTVGTMVASGATAAEVWDYLTTGTVVSDSVLEWILDKLDAKISSITSLTASDMVTILQNYDSAKQVPTNNKIADSEKNIINEIKKTSTTTTVEKKRPYKW